MCMVPLWCNVENVYHHTATYANMKQRHMRFVHYYGGGATRRYV